MNMLAPIEAPVGLNLPDTMTMPEWVELGRNLLSQRRSAEWVLGDWYEHGRRHFANDEQFQLFAEAVGEDPKRLAKVAQIAAAFPEAKRSTKLSFEVHSYLAAFPEDQRLDRLRQAEREGWTATKAKAATVEHRNQSQMFEDEDDDFRRAIEIVRVWNRAPIAARELFAEWADLNNLTDIDPDKAYA